MMNVETIAAIGAPAMTASPWLLTQPINLISFRACYAKAAALQRRRQTGDVRHASIHLSEPHPAKMTFRPVSGVAVQYHRVRGTWATSSRLGCFASAVSPPPSDVVGMTPLLFQVSTLPKNEE